MNIFPAKKMSEGLQRGEDGKHQPEKLYLPRMSKSTKLCPLVVFGILYMEKTLKTILCLVPGLPGLESRGHFVFPFCTPIRKPRKKTRDSTLQSTWVFFKLLLLEEILHHLG